MTETSQNEKKVCKPTIGFSFKGIVFRVLKTDDDVWVSLKDIALIIDYIPWRLYSKIYADPAEFQMHVRFPNNPDASVYSPSRARDPIYITRDGISILSTHIRGTHGTGPEIRKILQSLIARITEIYKLDDIGPAKDPHTEPSDPVPADPVPAPAPDPAPADVPISPPMAADMPAEMLVNHVKIAVAICKAKGIPKDEGITAAIKEVERKTGSDLAWTRQLLHDPVLEIDPCLPKTANCRCISTPINDPVDRLTVSQIGDILGVSGRAANQFLAEMGFQTKYGTDWYITDKGRQYADLEVYKVSTAPPGYRIFWKHEVIPFIEEFKNRRKPASWQGTLMGAA